MFGIMIEIGDFKSVTLRRSPVLFLSSRLETPVKNSGSCGIPGIRRVFSPHHLSAEKKKQNNSQSPFDSKV